MILFILSFDYVMRSRFQYLLLYCVSYDHGRYGLKGIVEKVIRRKLSCMMAKGKLLGNTSMLYLYSLIASYVISWLL